MNQNAAKIKMVISIFIALFLIGCNPNINPSAEQDAGADAGSCNVISPGDQIALSFHEVGGNCGGYPGHIITVGEGDSCDPTLNDHGCSSTSSLDLTCYIEDTQLRLNQKGSINWSKNSPLGYGDVNIDILNKDTNFSCNSTYIISAEKL